MAEHRGDDQIKPCRACHDFKSWTKLQGKANAASEKRTQPDKKPDSNGTEEKPCPLDKDGLGRNTWSFLHTMAAYYPDKPTEQQRHDAVQFFKLFSHFYPCDVCADDLQKQLGKFPPKTNSQEELSQWLCRIHNRVNLRLGKAQFDCSKVNQRWKDGWLDGSCD